VNLTAIRQGLADRMSELPNVQAKRFVPDSISMITAVVLPGDPYVDYHGTFGDGRRATINLEVLLLLPKNVDFDWQAKLDDLCSTGTLESVSVIDVIEDDRTLAISGLTCRVIAAHGWGTTTVNAVEYGSIRFSVQAYQHRT
jgi:hypothetical protein